MSDGYGQLSLAVDDLISNPNTLHLVNHRLVSTRLKHLAINTSPLAIELLEYYIDQLNDYEWSLVSSNLSSLSLIKKHQDIVKLLKKGLSLRNISGLTNNKSTNTIMKVRKIALQLNKI